VFFRAMEEHQQNFFGFFTFKIGSLKICFFAGLIFGAA
jgi:hypothetical protein